MIGPSLITQLGPLWVMSGRKKIVSPHFYYSQLTTVKLWQRLSNKKCWKHQNFQQKKIPLILSRSVLVWNKDFSKYAEMAKMSRYTLVSWVVRISSISVLVHVLVVQIPALPNWYSTTVNQFPWVLTLSYAKIIVYFRVRTYFFYLS